VAQPARRDPPPSALSTHWGVVLKCVRMTEAQRAAQDESVKRLRAALLDNPKGKP
jgi:hypothetical protein